MWDYGPKTRGGRVAGSPGNLDLQSTWRGVEAKDRFWPDANNGTADIDGDTARWWGFARSFDCTTGIYQLGITGSFR